MKQKLFTTAVLITVLLMPFPSSATKVLGLRVIDKNYLMVHCRDGEVHYRDDGIGPSAYLGHSFAEGDDTLLVFGERLKTDRAQQSALWKISSSDDKAFGTVRPQHVWRKSKPMNFDHTLTSELDHWLFLQLPKAMKQGCTYTVTIPKGIGIDETTSLSVCFDIWNAQSEAVHVNILGYVPSEQIHAADLYQWLGDGGQRDYKAFEGRQVYLYDVKNKTKTDAGTVKFWKPASAFEQEAGKKNLIGTDVWNIDFKTVAPGRYRLVVEDVGCSMDFDISPNVYYEPYRFSVRGYYYMRLGEPKNPEHVWPVPRQPQFIPDEDPKELTVYKTDLTPWSKEWRDLHTDVWDEPHFKKAEASIFWKHRLPGNPVNTIVRGGHSDAFDWDRHLAHVSNIYDMLLPFILSDGRLVDDNLGIRESGNGIPDLIDEARNEVDFFLSIRDGEAYSQGVTNPSNDWTVMFQAGCTTMAAWANAANCAVLGEAFRLQHNDSLRQYYTTEAIKAFRFAEKQENQQLDDLQDVGSMQMRGRDFRQLAAAFLYNLTSEQEWETVFAEESMIKTPASPLFSRGRQGFFGVGVTNQYGAREVPFCQLWAAVAYLTCPHPRHHATLYDNLRASINAQAESYNISHMAERPSRRSANDSRWQVSQNLQLVMMAHYMADDVRKRELEHVMFTEAGWALGRNPGNIVEMTGLGERHITDCYTTGRNDGAPECHPGQTPFNGTETWSPGHNGGDAQVILKYCYPAWDNGWPRQESYFNQRYFWVNGEFTPRETMRGKMALLGYLNAIGQQQKPIVVLYENDMHCAIDNYARLAGMRETIASGDSLAVALVSCGDYLQGGVAGSISKGQYIVDILRHMNYDAIGLGNHEFDYGVPRMNELLSQLPYPVVCANFFEAGSPVPFYAPYIIRQLGGRRVAFIGAVTGEAMRSEAYSFYNDNGHLLYDLKPMEVSRIVQQSVNEVRSQGADIVVLISHLGEQPVANTVNSHELVARTRGIDVVLDGHSHSTIECSEAPNLDGRMIPVSQTGTQLQNIGKLTITPEGKCITQLIPLSDAVYQQPHVKAVTDSVKALMKQVTDRELCRSDFDLSIFEADGKTRLVRSGEANIGDLVADAFRAILKTDIGLQNGGGIRNSIAKGTITYGKVLDALPFGNLMITLEATGQQIVDMLQKCATYTVEDGSFPQVSGLQFKITDRSGTRSVSDVCVLNGATGQFQPIDLTRCYTIATTEYTIKGGFYDTMKAARLLNTSTKDYCDCLVEFLSSFNGTIPPAYAKPQGRLTFVKE
jgi:2',3'-cyclic-nucleotide 2'-phosphodiesterase (5'-nucleotidase family)